MAFSWEALYFTRPPGGRGVRVASQRCLRGVLAFPAKDKWPRPVRHGIQLQQAVMKERALECKQPIRRLCTLSQGRFLFNPILHMLTPPPALVTTRPNPPTNLPPKGSSPFSYNTAHMDPQQISTPASTYAKSVRTSHSPPNKNTCSHNRCALKSGSAARVSAPRAPPLQNTKKKEDAAGEHM